MNTWNEILIENEADARAQLDESCHVCGVRLGEHYNYLNVWVPCRAKIEGETK
jgi:hypothetical protein